MSPLKLRSKLVQFLSALATLQLVSIFISRVVNQAQYLIDQQLSSLDKHTIYITIMVNTVVYLD
jgi:hypothetical protein